MADDDDDTWRPLSVRSGSARGRDDYDALHEGVPPWLHNSIETWLQAQFRAATPGRSTCDRAALLKAERVLRIELDWNRGTVSALESLFATSGPDQVLDVIDFALWHRGSPRSADQMRRILRDVTTGSAGCHFHRDHRGPGPA